MENDCLQDIKDGNFVSEDDAIKWLIKEVENLRETVTALKGLETSLCGIIDNASGYQSNLALPSLIDRLIYQRKGLLTESGEIHDTLAEALGYHKEAEDDPKSPCPGAYVTGEHTAATLAMEAAKKLRSHE